MSTAELPELEEIDALIANGRQLGVLVYAEVAQAVSEFDLDEADIEKLHRLLEKQGIELVEESEVLAAADAQGGPEAATRKTETTLHLEPEFTIDSLQSFLNHIGKGPLPRGPQ